MKTTLRKTVSLKGFHDLVPRNTAQVMDACLLDASQPMRSLAPPLSHRQDGISNSCSDDGRPNSALPNQNACRTKNSSLVSQDHETDFRPADEPFGHLLGSHHWNFVKIRFIKNSRIRCDALNADLFDNSRRFELFSPLETNGWPLLTVIYSLAKLLSPNRLVGHRCS